jgi:Carboxylesterase family
MVFHASTNPAVLAENVTFSAAELVLEQRFVDYWTSFVITGNPNSGMHIYCCFVSFFRTGFHCFLQRCTDLQPVQWPIWNPQTREAILLQTPTPAVTNASISPCTMWDAIGYDY